MSQYFNGHPQFYLIYSIKVQALYGDGMGAANKSEPVSISEFELYDRSVYIDTKIISGTFVLRDCSVTGSYPNSNTMLDLPSGSLRIVCSFVGAPRQLSISVTCNDCTIPQPPVTIIATSPIDIPDFMAARYSVEIFAVDSSEKRVEDNTIVKTTTVFTGKCTSYPYII